MAANKKPRKRYKPRGLIYDPIAYIKQGFAPLTSMTSANVDLRIKYHNAMAQIQTGNGVMHDIDTLIAQLQEAKAKGITTVDITHGGGYEG